MKKSDKPSRNAAFFKIHYIIHGRLICNARSLTRIFVVQEGEL